MIPRTLFGLLIVLAALGASAHENPTATTPVAATLDCQPIEDFDATFVLYRPERGETLACNPERAATRFLPASTFKITNALIGLETGAVADEHEVIAWDGTQRSIPAWNADADLACGMRDSVVWYYQSLARRIGPSTMRDWLQRFDYGNADIGPDDEIHRFWLDGSLRITAHEQVAFLDRLRRRELPLSRRSQDRVVHIMENDVGDGWVLRGKTGAAIAFDTATGELAGGRSAAAMMRGAARVGWYVGYVDRGGNGDAVFAFNMRVEHLDDLPLRTRRARALLEANGVLPAGD